MVNSINHKKPVNKSTCQKDKKIPNKKNRKNIYISV